VNGYALTDPALPPDFIDGNRGIIDVNAIEAISEEVVPEPSTALLALLSVTCLIAVIRRRSAKSNNGA